MTCEEMRERMEEYLDGELPEDIRQACSSHLEGCPACRALLREAEETATALRRLCPEPPDFVTPALEQLRAKKKTVHRRRVKQLTSVAAAVVICIAGGVYFWLGTAGGTSAAPAAMEMTEGAAEEAAPAEVESAAAAEEAADEEVPAADDAVEFRSASMSEHYLPRQEYEALLEGYNQRFSPKLAEKSDGDSWYVEIVAEEENLAFLRSFEGMEQVEAGELLTIYRVEEGA